MPGLRLLEPARLRRRRHPASIPWRTLRAALVLAAFGAIACSEAAPNTPDVAAGPVARASFEHHGIPGPWWRAGATQQDFDGDLAVCRAESGDARRAATAETRKDLAYRTFLDCMTRLSWRRGDARSS